MQDNSRSACQFWYKRRKEAQKLFATLHIDSLSAPRGRYWPYFCFMGCGFRDTGRISIFGHEPRPLAKVQKVAHTFSFYPKGLKLSLLSFVANADLNIINLGWWW